MRSPRARRTPLKLSRSQIAMPTPRAGVLVSADSYFNFQLADSEEYIDGALAGNLGEILIRCNNVLYIKEVSE